MQDFELIDISIPITSKTACFPGDTPFSKETTVSLDNGSCFNLTKLTMSPHVGTHADAPAHIAGSLDSDDNTAGTLALKPFIGPCLVLNLAPMTSEIRIDQVQGILERMEKFPERILFKTAKQLRHDVFEENYAYFSVELVEYLASRGVKLIGIDTPSVDQVSSKTLSAHHELVEARMSWLENLDLTSVDEGYYFLLAAPLKFMELEASPVRAVLIKHFGSS